jgi:hypothetical protein
VLFLTGAPRRLVQMVDLDGDSFSLPVYSLIACWLALGVETLLDQLARGVLFHPSIDMLDIHGDRLAQFRDRGLECLNGTLQNGLQHRVRESLQLTAKMSRPRHRLLDIETIGCDGST